MQSTTTANTYIPRGFVRRPPPGTLGRKVLVRTNHFAMTSVSSGNVHHYDVTITPEPKTRVLARKIFTQLLQGHAATLNNGRVVFDGAKNMYSAKELKPAQQEFRIDLDDAQEATSTPSSSTHTQQAPPAVPNTAAARGRGGNARGGGRGGGRGDGGAGRGRGAGRGGPAAAQAPTPAPKSEPPAPGEEVKKLRDSFAVRIKKVATVNMHELQQFLNGKAGISDNVLTCLTVIHVALNHSPMLRYTPLIRGSSASFFPGQGPKPGTLPGGLEIWQGFFQSVRFTPSRLSVNVDAATACYYKGNMNLAMYISLFFGRDKAAPNFYSPAEKKNFERFIRNLVVTLSYRRFGMKQRVVKLSDVSAKTLMFDCVPVEGGPPKKISVATFFNTKYNLRLSFPDLPCALLGKKLLCTVAPAQRFARQLSPQQLSELIKITASRPEERVAKIIAAREALNYDADPILQDFEIKIDKNMTTVNARLLPEPRLRYRNDRSQPMEVATPRGVWNMMGKQVLSPCRIQKIGVINLATYDTTPKTADQAWLIATDLVVAWLQAGLQIHPTMIKSAQNPEPDYCVVDIDPKAPFDTVFREAITTINNYNHDQNAQIRPPPPLIIVFMAERSVDRYADIKRIAETEMGVMTQCLQAKKVSDKKGFGQYAANVALKVNAKVAATQQAIGVNTALVQQPQHLNGTMVMGADVTHPSPGADGQFSIAGIVASMNPSATRYLHQVRFQGARVEEIQDMESVTQRFLEDYRRRNGNLPQKILFYRDGVSDGQYERVRTTEIEAIQRACAATNTNIRLTFVVVKKRHHTRFFATNPSDTDRSGNLLPGLVVDTVVTHPTDFDFFLQSQAGLIGTSRPTHYYVIHDDCKLKSDELQLLTYHLCFTYARATRSVSVVPPAYYAHLICFRARYYARMAGSSASTQSDAPPPTVNVHSNLTNSMFYM
ncbi:hypothetical protein RI367_002594 [Sorochytrium milnesiophthora]